MFRCAVLLMFKSNFTRGKKLFDPSTNVPYKTPVVHNYATFFFSFPYFFFPSFFCPYIERRPCFYRSSSKKFQFKCGEKHGRIGRIDISCHFLCSPSMFVCIWWLGSDGLWIFFIGEYQN